MKPKYILLLSIILLLIVVGFMVVDLFLSRGPNPNNPYEYDMSSLKQTDTSLICYEELSVIKPETDHLYGIALDIDDRLFVAGSSKILIYSKDGSFMDSIHLEDNAYCLAVAESGLIYLGMADHVEVYNVQGDRQQIWESKGDLAIFTSIAVNENSVFVADAGNKIVYHYDLNGQLQNKIGEKDIEKGISGYIIPSGYFDLLIGRNNELWVVNPGMHQFESYRPDGTLISSWQRVSMQLDGFSGCCNPSHIAMLSDGSFVTSEKGIERVKIHLQTGDFKCVVAGPDEFIAGTTDLDLAVNSEDQIYISDPKKGLIRIFGLIEK